MTWKPGSKSLGRPRGVRSRRSGQPGGRATRRAVAKANGSSAEIVYRMKLIEAEFWRCQGCHSCPMASAGPEATARSTDRVPRRTEGGNSGESSSKSPEGEEGRQDDPMNVKDRAYNPAILRMGGLAGVGWDRLAFGRAVEGQLRGDQGGWEGRPGGPGCIARAVACSRTLPGAPPPLGSGRARRWPDGLAVAS